MSALLVLLAVAAVALFCAAERLDNEFDGDGTREAADREAAGGDGFLATTSRVPADLETTARVTHGPRRRDR